MGRPNGLLVTAAVEPEEMRDERFARLIGSFLQFARTRDWRVAILGASESALDVYRSDGLRALYDGDEAVVDTTTFSLRLEELARDWRGAQSERGFVMALDTLFRLDDERRRDLPRVGIAALAAEAYLPFSGRGRE